MCDNMESNDGLFFSGSNTGPNNPIYPANRTNNQLKIVAFSDTFGVPSGNGVGRFLWDLSQRHFHAQKPWWLVVPGKDESHENLIQVRSPSFQVPGYDGLTISIPLEHHRKRLSRDVRHLKPDCIHVSTPGPFGMQGLAIARRLRVPLVGIHHSDFPAYAKAVTRHLVLALSNDPAQLLSPLTSAVLPFVLPLLGRLQSTNPDWLTDIANVRETLKRNQGLLGHEGRVENLVAELAERVTRDLMGRFYSQFTMVIARSGQQRSLLARDFKIKDEHVKYLRPGTDIERFHPKYRSDELRQQLGISPDSFLLLHVGRLTPEKGVELLRCIWGQLAHQSDVPIHLILVGKGQSSEIAQFEAKERIHLLGAKYGEELSRIYASCDALIFPSTTETLGQVGLEAGASGLPVIASSLGGASDYILDGVTGRLLDSRDAREWSTAVRDLCDGGTPSIRVVGDAARRHIEANYSIESSIECYWRLHEEASEMYQKQRKRAAKVIRSNRVKEPQANGLPTKKLMVISDYHAGRYFKSPREREEKQAAIRAMFRKARELDAEVLLGGDFADHGSMESRMLADFECFRACRAEFGFTEPMTFVRGNHDYGFSDSQLSQWVGGCTVHPSLVYNHRESGVTFTHGHILGLAKTVAAIEARRGGEFIEQQLSESQLDADLKPSVVAYDAAHLIEKLVTRYGLNGLTTLWDGLYPHRADLAEKLLDLAAKTKQEDRATWKMIAGLIGTHDSVGVAGSLGFSSGTWATIFGHTHVALIKRLEITEPETRKPIPHLIGNAGHINRRGATCIIAGGGLIKIWKYIRKRDRLVAIRSLALDNKDISLVQLSESFQANGSLKASA